MPLPFNPEFAHEGDQVTLRSRVKFKADPESAELVADMLAKDTKALLPSSEWQKHSYWPSKTSPGYVIIEIEDIGNLNDLSNIQMRHEAVVEAQIRVQVDRHAVSIDPNEE